MSSVGTGKCGVEFKGQGGELRGGRDNTLVVWGFSGDLVTVKEMLIGYLNALIIHVQRSF